MTKIYPTRGNWICVWHNDDFTLMYPSLTDFDMLVGDSRQMSGTMWITKSEDELGELLEVTCDLYSPNEVVSIWRKKYNISDNSHNTIEKEVTKIK